MVIQGGTVIDVRTGTLQPNSVVVIENGRISRVGPAGQFQPPAGATMVDATGKFVMPGLWDSHAHTRDYDGDLNINHGVTSTMDMGPDSPRRRRDGLGRRRPSRGGPHPRRCRR
jgi:imidazolonepropionase-like amidohydrolase